MNSIPNEIFNFYILQTMDIKSLFNLSLTNKYFYDLLKDLKMERVIEEYGSLKAPFRYPGFYGFPDYFEIEAIPLYIRHYALFHLTGGKKLEYTKLDNGEIKLTNAEKIKFDVRSYKLCISSAFEIMGRFRMKMDKKHSESQYLKFAKHMMQLAIEIRGTCQCLYFDFDFEPDDNGFPNYLANTGARPKEILYDDDNELMSMSFFRNDTIDENLIPKAKFTPSLAYVFVKLF